MGIDFNNLIANLGRTAAKLQNNQNKIDSKTELNTYVSGWDAIKAKAEAENKSVDNNIDINNLEATMKSELASLMGAEFGNTAGVQNKGTAKEPMFSDEEISLENMMALLEPEDGLDINKLREQNKKPMLSSGANEVEAMTKYGFDPELTNIVMEQTPGAMKYISDAIKSGRADAIANDTAEFGEGNEAVANFLLANKEELWG